jgi:hypothetical protein
MTGPDSDLWPANSDDSRPWDWQSSKPCDATLRPVEDDPHDDGVVMVVARYTLENLILNAVHEIGEWFRFDGERVFPAHPSSSSTSDQIDDQGNGAVNLTVVFGAGPDLSADRGPGLPVDQLQAQRRLRRLREAAGPPRFTYLPAISIQYRATGPMICHHRPGLPATEWSALWSMATLGALDRDADTEELLASMKRDIHGALVAWEADRICHAFHLDGRRLWQLAATPPTGGETLDPQAEPIALVIDYTAGPEEASTALEDALAVLMTGPERPDGRLLLGLPHRSVPSVPAERSRIRHPSMPKGAVLPEDR